MRFIISVIVLGACSIACIPSGNDALPWGRNKEKKLEIDDNGNNLLCKAKDYLYDEQSLAELLKKNNNQGESVEQIAEHPDREVADSVVRGLLQVRNKLAHFTGRPGKETFRDRVRGVAADLYLRVINTADGTYSANGAHSGPVANVLNGVASLIDWTKEEVQLDIEDKSIIQSTRAQLARELDEAHAIVKQIGEQIASGAATLTPEVQERLQTAMVKISEVSQQLGNSVVPMRQTVTMNLSQVAGTILVQVKSLLQNIIDDADHPRTPVDMITRASDTFGELLTIHLEQGSPLKRIVKTILLAIARTQAPVVKRFGIMIENAARQWAEFHQLNKDDLNYIVMCPFD